ncbi:hypothetical protein SAMN04515647_3447 [Cohaesibacter sp. ES.047]|nr:hypothetical protein SAMN04515647_3447 [Cohaesibacter sp. ES.047]
MTGTANFSALVRRSTILSYLKAHLETGLVLLAVSVSLAIRVGAVPIPQTG